MQKTIAIFLILFSALCQLLSSPHGPAGVEGAAILRPYNDPAFLDAEIRRVRAGKGGISVPIPVLKERYNLGFPVFKAFEDKDDEDDLAEGSGERGDDDEDASRESSRSDEGPDITCAPGKGWHDKGQRCVPIECEGGESYRDYLTGICIRSYSRQTHPGSGIIFKTYMRWNKLSHVYKNHPAQRILSKGERQFFHRGKLAGDTGDLKPE